MPAFEYAPAPDSPSLAAIRPSYGLFIGGEFVEPRDGVPATTVNPATEQPLAEVAAAGPSDVDAAVAAARTAYEHTWRGMPGRERAKYLYRIARLLQERAGEFAVLETLDNGKPVRQARALDIPLAAAHFFHYAGWADKLRHAGLGSSGATPGGGDSPEPGTPGAEPGGPDPRPLGVAGQLVDWSFPLLTLAWRVAPALACGNTVVLKPADTTPLSALHFAQVCQQADLPRGVVNVVTGAGQTGRHLIEHPGLDLLAYAGSTAAGRQVARSLAGTGRRLALQLGGNSANIVFEDAAIDQAVEGIVDGIFLNQGHARWAGSRLLVQESVAEALVDALKRRMGRLRLGNPLDKNTDIGAVNSAAQLAKIHELVAAGEQEGAQRWSPPCALPERGFWFAPTIFTGVSQAHRIAREEIFGPVLSVLTFRTPAEAVEKANNTPYGLAAGVWSEKGSRVLAIAEQLRAGVVWANTFNKFDPVAPFGGYKESGYGRDGGRYGLEAYLEH
jgi:aldehyde dehydrogenase (NAD+)